MSLETRLVCDALSRRARCPALGADARFGGEAERRPRRK